jgi:hypothetical protein
MPSIVPDPATASTWLRSPPDPARSGGVKQGPNRAAAGNVPKDDHDAPREGSPPLGGGTRLALAKNNDPTPSDGECSPSRRALPRPPASPVGRGGRTQRRDGG